MRLVEHLLRGATDGRSSSVSLDTRPAPAFGPARELTTAAGFEPCTPFAGYPSTPASIWMARRLDPS